jgi:hypothetical protein
VDAGRGVKGNAHERRSIVSAVLCFELQRLRHCVVHFLINCTFTLRSYGVFVSRSRYHAVSYSSALTALGSMMLWRSDVADEMRSS